MELGIIGLGRMGGNMALRLAQDGHRVRGYTRNQPAVDLSHKESISLHKSVEDVVGALKSPRIVWMMVPAGDATESTFQRLLNLLSPGDIIIDGGNSYYKDSLRRAKEAEERQLSFLDAGTSGGVWGLEVGYCLMIGGPEKAYRQAEPIFKTLAPENGYGHMGPAGSGHYVKMVHNGIEYGMLQAYGEGFEILEGGPFSLDLEKIAKVWMEGSVVRSWLLELAVDAFKKDPHLEKLKGYVDDSGEGRWTVLESIDQSTPAPVIALSLMARFASRQDESFSAKVIAALRNEFGGHAVKHD